MSSETDYLASFLANPFELSLTITSAQRPRSRPGQDRTWEPGLASYGWANLGRRQHTGNAVTGLVFSARVWFSDRRTNSSVSPTDWQQFAAHQADPIVFTFTESGDPRPPPRRADPVGISLGRRQLRLRPTIRAVAVQDPWRGRRGSAGHSLVILRTGSRPLVIRQATAR